MNFGTRVLMAFVLMGVFLGARVEAQDQQNIKFSVGFGYFGNAGFGVQASMTNVLAPGVGLQLRGGIGAPIDGTSAQIGAVEVNTFLDIDLIYGIDLRLAFGSAYDFRGFWLMQGRFGLEYHPDFLGGSRNLGVFGEFGTSYRFPIPGQGLITNGNALSFSAGLSWRF